MSPSTFMQSTVRYNLILIQDVTEDYQSLNEKYDEENMERKVLDLQRAHNNYQRCSTREFLINININQLNGAPININFYQLNSSRELSISTQLELL